MNELQLSAAKKAGIAVLAAICFILIFKMSPILAIMLIFLTAVGGGSYMLFMDMEHSKTRQKEYEKRMNDLARMRRDTVEEAIDKINR